MDEEYYLSPFITVTMGESGELIIKNLLQRDKKMLVTSFDKIDPEIEEIRNFCFINGELKDYIKESFEKLERFFKRQKEALGYIETTSNCPYHCRICPKGYNEQIRENSDLSVQIFESVVKQIRGQEYLALHLFGDPFYDKHIYEKIHLANIYDIKPSFSTNLVSLNNINFNEITKLKIKDLTISFDSSDNRILTLIRGKVLQKTIERSIDKIRKLVKLAEQSGCIDRVLIQKIQLSNNNDDIQELEKIASESYITEFVHKKFIRFPKVSDYSEYGTLEQFEKGKSVFLYHLLGVKTPFRCLKPWIKNELSMNSDGDFVPCCLTLNKSIDLHNVRNKSLKDVFESDEHYRFRKSVFYDLLDGNDTCLNCPINVPNLKIPLDIEESVNFKKLKKMTVSDWRVVY